MAKLSVMLAKEYIDGQVLNKKDKTFLQPPKGWYMSEKFDGYRALFRYEDGQGKFYSRAGKPFSAPEWFYQSMPPYELLGDNIIDGELWAGRDNFELMGVVRKKIPIAEEWATIQFHVYDITNLDKVFYKRINELKSSVNFTTKSWQIKVRKKYIQVPDSVSVCPIICAEQIKITSIIEMNKYYDNIISLGGEGIMLKHPKSPYENGRSTYMLKYKPSFDREAIIIDYKEGAGKYSGLLGSFICRQLVNHDTYSAVDEDDGRIFTLSGMDDTIRNNYQSSHPPGTIISFECSGFTGKGVPRFARYIRIRDDIIMGSPDNLSREILDKVVLIMSFLENYYKSNGDSFRCKTYIQVNKSLMKLVTDKELSPGNLKLIDGIGAGTITRIKEIMDTGTLQEYEKVKNKVSPVTEFLKIHGVGIQHAKKLVATGFTTVEELRDSPDIKEHLNDVQMKGLRYFKDIQQRIPYNEIQKREIILKNILKSIDPKAELTIAGSYRRKKTDSGDIDILLKSKEKKTYNDFIDKLKESKYLVEDLARGPKKYMGIAGGMTGDKTIAPTYMRRVDIMYTKPEEYPFAVLYFTGSSEFNQRQRADALKMGYTMNEYSIKHTDTMIKVDKLFRTERDIFTFLNYDYLDPDKRID
jgi:DNA polymerase/3'-5' exonuclease PolX